MIKHLSRPNYDKPRRCPSWSGPGWISTRPRPCPSGMLPINYERGWSWRFHRCPKCGVLVLPYVVRWTSPTSYWLEIRYRWGRFRDWLWWRGERRRRARMKEM